MGDHLRKHIADTGLTWRAAAKLLGVGQDTLSHWLAGRKTPRTSHWPGILRFLGCDPRRRPETLGEQLISWRQARGLQQEQLANILKVAGTTLRRWEQGRAAPKRDFRRRVERVLQGG